jgi:hypothetical protein
LRRALWFVTGADAEVLCDPDCPESERTKFDSIGLAMCLTTGLAFLSGVSAFYQIFFPGLHRYELLGTPWRMVISLLFAGIWTLVIFNMQRFIMLGSRRVSDHGALHLGDWLHALPSVLLSLAVSLTLATPLQVFLLAPEIDVHLMKEQQTRKRVVHASIEAKYAAEGQDLREQAMQLREQTGHDLTWDSVGVPSCLSSGSNGPDGLPQLQECLRQVDQWNAVLIQRQAAWRELHGAIGGAARSREAEAEWLSLQDEWRKSRMTRERLYADILLEQQAGLLKRAGIAYEVNPLSSWAIFLVVVFIQAVPVLIRTLSVRGPYEDLLGMLNRRYLAAAGIEPAALFLFDREGKSYPVDSYLMSKNTEQRMLSALQAQRHALREARLARFEERYSAIMRSSPNPFADGRSKRNDD